MLATVSTISSRSAARSAPGAAARTKGKRRSGHRRIIRLGLVEKAARRFRLVAVDPVEIGGGELVMRLDGAAVRRRLGEHQLRLGPVLQIFPFFLRHSTWIIDTV